MRYLRLIVFFSLILSGSAYGQWSNSRHKTLITPFRYVLPPSYAKIEYEDLDGDGDPDILRTLTNGDIPVLWIDDDDDMKEGDLEGDTDSDCLIIDKNKDGYFGHEHDVMLDWGDEDGDDVPDIQVFVETNSLENTSNGPGHYMIVVDTDKDKIFNYIDWREIYLRAWDRNGHSHFFEDYLGQSLFLKAHASTWTMSDIRRGVENPFLFYDPDNDNNPEYTIKFDDRAKYVRGIPPHSKDDIKNGCERGVIATGNIQWAGISLDLDNDNAPGNEFDLDMTIHWFGEGFSYNDQVHKFNSLRGLPETDSLFLDPRWRQNTELVYADHEAAYDLIFDRGKWDYCWFVFDEDDDCARWERVELYFPKNLFKIGQKQGGIDDQRQSDCAGDRGEWDADNSGNGNLYLAKFDGRIHLHGAEWGAWRIDQEAKYYQGWGGIYDGTLKRSQKQPDKFATIKYDDSDGNGFIDRLSYDLDGDTIFEKVVDFNELGISDACDIIDVSKMDYEKYTGLYKNMTESIWARAKEATILLKSKGLNPDWYSFIMQPNSLREKYHYGYWLNFYAYMDLLHQAELLNAQEQMQLIDKAYHSGDWSLLK